MMVTPRVREEARAYFNCSDLEGAEIESQGGAGTAFSHWEKRVLEVSPHFLFYKKLNNHALFKE